MDLVKSQGKADQQNINHRYYGDNYMEILSKGLDGSGINFYTFKANNIKEKGAQELLDNINKEVKCLDFSSNRIGNKGSLKLA